jgi:hypothetical protein
MFVLLLTVPLLAIASAVLALVMGMRNRRAA